MDKSFQEFNKVMADVQAVIHPEQNLESIESKIIQQIPKQTLPNQFYYVINNASKKCIYATDSITELTGYTPDEWTYDLILKLIHPDDKAFLDEALSICFKIGMSPIIHLPIKDAMIVNYRIKHKKGHYIHILRNGYWSSMNPNNKMIHNTSMCMVIDDFKYDNKQSMFIKEGNKILYELHSDNMENPKWGLLSKREREIVELLCENKTSEQIGQHLFISKHTVDTHRRKILKKLNLKNTTELLFKYLNENL